jgi:hypothetical protein
MTQLKDKIQDAMDESRMLVLGAEILIGFEFTAIFQDGFKKLSTRSQNLNVIALTLMLFTLVLLLSPRAFHQLAESGEDSIRLHRFATRVMEVALFPFALGLGATVYIPAEEINGAATGLVFGLATTFLACFFWYGPVLLRGTRTSQRKAGNSVRQGDSTEGTAHTPVHDKIRQVLTEAPRDYSRQSSIVGLSIRGGSATGLWRTLTLVKMGASGQSFVHRREHYFGADSRSLPPHCRAWRGNGELLSSWPCHGPLLVAAARHGGMRRLLPRGLQDDRQARLFARRRDDYALRLVGMWFGYTCFRRNHPGHVSVGAIRKAAEK